MRREVYLRPLRPITALEQTTQIGTAVRIYEDAMGSPGTGQTGAGTNHIQEDVAQCDGDRSWYDEDTGCTWYDEDTGYTWYDEDPVLVVTVLESSKR